MQWSSHIAVVRSCMLHQPSRPHSSVCQLHGREEHPAAALLQCCMLWCIAWLAFLVELHVTSNALLSDVMSCRHIHSSIPCACPIPVDS